MAITKVNAKLDFGNANRIINLAPATANGQAVVFEQLNSAIQGLAWKDNVRVASSTNVDLASPVATIDGVTLSSGDTVLLISQTVPTENGIWVFDTSTTPLTRSLDADTFSKLENAVVIIDEGTYSGLTYRQTQVNGIIGTNDIIWTSFGVVTPDATDTVKGKVRLATQAEVDAGSTDAVVTATTLASYTGYVKKYAETIGDGTTLNYTVTHNLNTEDIASLTVLDLSDSKYYTIVSWKPTGVNTVSVEFDSAPTTNSIRVIISA
jgi:hypothetical protein